MKGLFAFFVACNQSRVFPFPKTKKAEMEKRNEKSERKNVFLKKASV